MAACNQPKLRTYHGTMLVTRAEEWCVDAASPEEARALLASAQGHRCHLGEVLDIELERCSTSNDDKLHWKAQRMPHLNGILETSLYTDDMDRARVFYEGVLGLTPMFADSRLTACLVAIPQGHDKNR